MLYTPPFRMPLVILSSKGNRLISTEMSMYIMETPLIGLRLSDTSAPYLLKYLCFFELLMTSKHFTHRKVLGDKEF